MVDESLLHILKRGIAGYLSPPAFEHTVVKGRLVDHARVEVVDLELRQVHLDGGVQGRALTYIEPLHGMAAVSAVQEFEELFSVDEESLGLSLVLRIDVHVGVGWVVAHLTSGSVQVFLLLVDLTEVFDGLHHTRVLRFKMVVRHDKLIERHALV